MIRRAAVPEWSEHLADALHEVRDQIVTLMEGSTGVRAGQENAEGRPGGQVTTGPKVGRV